MTSSTSSNRYERLSQALRQNLMKRKQKARAQKALEPMAGATASPETTQTRPVRRKLWGRSISRPLSEQQKSTLHHTLERFGIPLPSTAPAGSYALPSAPKWDATFWTDYGTHILEIGFGDGEHLMMLAERHKDAGIIGAERFINGVVAACESLSEKTFTHLRLFPDDAGFLWSTLPKESLDHVYVLFPDPWPKKRHHKRRLLQNDFFNVCHAYLKPGGTLWIASDIVHYVDQVRDTMSQLPKMYQATGEHEAPLTKYGRKAVREGRSSVMLSYKKV